MNIGGMIVCDSKKAIKNTNTLFRKYHVQIPIRYKEEYSNMLVGHLLYCKPIVERESLPNCTAGTILKEESIESLICSAIFFFKKL